MNNYDKCVEMLCLTGKIPVNMYDALCQEASRQIHSSITLAMPTKADREFELFGDKHRAESDWKSAWFDYEMDNADNFSMD